MPIEAHAATVELHIGHVACLMTSRLPIPRICPLQSMSPIAKRALLHFASSLTRLPIIASYTSANYLTSASSAVVLVKMAFSTAVAPASMMTTLAPRPLSAHNVRSAPHRAMVLAVRAEGNIREEVQGAPGTPHPPPTHVPLAPFANYTRTLVL